LSSVIEAMGISLPYSSTMGAEDEEKAESTEKCAFVLVEAIRKQILPSSDYNSQIHRKCYFCHHGTR
jgi:dihydroxy-acid dehydratase